VGGVNHTNAADIEVSADTSRCDLWLPLYGSLTNTVSREMAIFGFRKQQCILRLVMS
jgi:hypothetical protein